MLKNFRRLTLPNLDFTLVNQTNVPLHSLHVAPSQSTEWDEDLFEDGTVLGHGESVNITFSPANTATSWDLRIADSEGNYLYWTGIQLDQVSQVTLFYNDGVGTAQFA